MQTFKRYLKPIGKVVCFLLCFALANGVIAFFIEPFCSPSSQMWDLYYAREDDDLDMVFVGTSECYEDIDPDVVDEILGTTSQNMGTNAQSYVDSKRAIQTALEDHDLKYVVLVLDPFYLEEGNERYSRPQAAFARASARGQGLLKQLTSAASYCLDEKYVFSPDSLNYIFPWVDNHIVFNRQMFVANLSAKLSSEWPEPSDFNNVRESNGYKGFDRIMDYNTAKTRGTRTWSEGVISDESVGELNQICNLCEEAGTELIVVVPPFPVSVTLSYWDDYFTRNAWLQKYFDYQGVDFYDMNLAKSTLFDSEEYYFKDWDHCNKYGAAAFSEALGNLIKASEDGEATSNYFYNNFGTYFASIQDIDSVRIYAKVNEDNKIEVSVGSYTGSTVSVEYKLVVKRYGDEEYQTVWDYSTSRGFVYTPYESGTYVFQVRARKAGSDGTAEKYHNTTVYYEAD